MNLKRRHFLKLSAISLPFAGSTPLFAKSSSNTGKNVKKPIVISTWNHGLAANEAAWRILKSGGRALDAVEQGVMVPEADPEVRTVGLGGYPDREGKVTLDACIIDENGDCGSVAFLQHIVHPVSVARMVMEKTPHLMLVGEGALQFALKNGFKKEDLLTPQAAKDHKEWLKKSEYKPVINIENHDTIGMLALDADGNLSGACTTSGAAWKMHGRVGDSPIIGAGLYLDNEVGAACATGMGELVIREAGSAMIVEQMRQGKSPGEACRHIVERIFRKQKHIENLQVGFLALNKAGEFGSYSIQSGFNFAIHDKEGNRMTNAQSKFGSR